MVSKDWWWGRSCSVDLHDCDRLLLDDPKAIREFVRKLCVVLKMRRHGPTRVERFGHGRLRGYSMLQFIETSSISAHFDSFGQRAFIDVFSCKKYDPRKVALFCQKYFKSSTVSTYVEERL